MTYKGTFAYIEFITRSVSRIKRDGKIIKQHNENTISGHYEVIDEDSKMILHNGSESPLISFAVGGMKATQHKDSNFFK